MPAKGKGRKGGPPSQAKRIFPRRPVDGGDGTENVERHVVENFTGPVASDVEMKPAVSKTESSNTTNNKDAPLEVTHGDAYDITAGVEFSDMSGMLSVTQKSSVKEFSVDLEKSSSLPSRTKETMYEIIDGCCKCKQDCSLSSDSAVIICGNCCNRIHTHCFLQCPLSSCPICFTRLFPKGFATPAEVGQLKSEIRDAKLLADKNLEQSVPKCKCGKIMVYTRDRRTNIVRDGTWACDKCVWTLYKDFKWNKYDVGHFWCPSCSIDLCDGCADKGGFEEDNTSNAVTDMWDIFYHLFIVLSTLYFCYSMKYQRDLANSAHGVLSHHQQFIYTEYDEIFSRDSDDIWREYQFYYRVLQDCKQWVLFVIYSLCFYGTNIVGFYGPLVYWKKLFSFVKTNGRHIFFSILHSCLKKMAPVSMEKVFQEVALEMTQKPKNKKKNKHKKK